MGGVALEPVYFDLPEEDMELVREIQRISAIPWPNGDTRTACDVIDALPQNSNLQEARRCVRRISLLTNQIKQVRV